MAAEPSSSGGLTWTVVLGAIASCALVHLGFSFFGVESMFHDWGNGLREMFNMEALPVHDHAHHAAHAFNDVSGAGAAQAGYAYTPMGGGFSDVPVQESGTIIDHSGHNHDGFYHDEQGQKVMRFGQQFFQKGAAGHMHPH